MLALTGSLRATTLDLSVIQSLIHIEGAAGAVTYNQTQASGSLAADVHYADWIPDASGQFASYYSQASAFLGIHVSGGTLEVGVDAMASAFVTEPRDPGAYAVGSATFEGKIHIARPVAFTATLNGSDEGSGDFLADNGLDSILSRIDGSWSLALHGFEPTDGILQPGDYLLRLRSGVLSAGLGFDSGTEGGSFTLSTRPVAEGGQTVLLLALGLAGIIAFAVRAPVLCPRRGDLEAAR